MLSCTQTPLNFRSLEEIWVASDFMCAVLLQQENLGFSAEELVPLNVREPLPKPASRQLPVHNGFGSLEDSAQNCISLVGVVWTSMCILVCLCCSARSVCCRKALIFQ